MRKVRIFLDLPGASERYLRAKRVGTRYHKYKQHELVTKKIVTNSEISPIYSMKWQKKRVWW